VTWYVGGSGGIAPLILNVGAGRSEVLTSAALPRGKGAQIPSEQEVGWVQRRSERLGEGICISYQLGIETLTVLQLTP
jgi:hypothetical protein